ncbi:hypothetical protein [uncultured Lacinutrix sp.]|uniref:hypothetical protein n=1 Tax=uncultured Lacinutrix sp. TaxID=574032 RepID=UPI002604A321|nr:hypothetical protein [uncultured Lacinutrix sp.]
MDAKKTVQDLDEKVMKGKLTKVNERESYNTGVTDGNKLYNCKIIIDLYKDLDGNDLFRIEHHIDQNNNYHTIDINQYNNGFI